MQIGSAYTIVQHGGLPVVPYSLSSIPNVNHFISVTKHTGIYHVSYSWTYLNKLILQILLF